MNSAAANRHHAIDAVRTVALLLLIVYHALCNFQPWASDAYMIENPDHLEVLWIPMGLLNVWRMPILFLVSGMGVSFALKRRSARELITERSWRILMPLVFGSFTIGPLCWTLVSAHNGDGWIYYPTPYHLWFLGYIYFYVLASLPLLIWMHRSPENTILRAMRGLLQSWVFLIVFAIPGALIAWITAPNHYANYAESVHGFVLGWWCFLLGFLCSCCIDDLKNATTRWWRWSAWSAFLLFVLRLLQDLVHTFLPLTALESMLWMMAVLGYAFEHWNTASPFLKRANAAVYPVYILHQPITFILMLSLIDIPGWAFLKLLVVISGTLMVSLAITERLLKPMPRLRPVFGMK